MGNPMGNPVGNSMGNLVGNPMGIPIKMFRWLYLCNTLKTFVKLIPLLKLFRATNKMIPKKIKQVIVNLQFSIDKFELNHEPDTLSTISRLQFILCNSKYLTSQAEIQIQCDFSDTYFKGPTYFSCFSLIFSMSYTSTSIYIT